MERPLREEAGDLWARGKFAQAEVVYRQMLLQQPRDPQLWVRHAETLKRLNRVDESIDSYRRAAVMLAELGHMPRAVAALRVALEMRPGDLDLISELIHMEMKKSQRSTRTPASVASAPTQPLPTPEEMLALPVLDEPVTKPGITIEVVALEEWPKVQRISSCSVALKPGPDARWVIIESATELQVSFADALPEPEPDDGLG
jgi:hypothetical protein